MARQRKEGEDRKYRTRTILKKKRRIPAFPNEEGSQKDRADSKTSPTHQPKLTARGREERGESTGTVLRAPREAISYRGGILEEEVRRR